MVFLAFRESLFRSSQSVICFNSSLIADDISICPYSIPVLKVHKGSINEVSSAYKIALNLFETVAISLIYIIKSSGPKMDPCGTPVVTSAKPDCAPLYSTYCLRADR